MALCVDLLVFGDEIREGDETLILSVIPDNPLDVIAGPSSVTVTIVDEVTDGKGYLEIQSYKPCLYESSNPDSPLV